MRLLLLLLLMSCGPNQATNNRPAPIENPDDDDDDDGEITYEDMEALHNKYCVSCHPTGFTDSERALRASSAKQRVQNKSMPPPNAPTRMGDADREKYLSFFF